MVNIFISQVVLDEIKQGDPEMVNKRLEVLQGIPMLEINDEVESLAVRYFESLQFPDKAIRDAFHLAYAVVYEVDFLATWNCTHLANADVLFRLPKLNKKWGYETPIVCTPEELIGYPQEE